MLLAALNKSWKQFYKGWSGRPGFNPRSGHTEDFKNIVLDNSLLNTQHYKVHIKGKALQYWESSTALPYTFGSPSTTVTNFTLLMTIYIWSHKLSRKYKLDMLSNAGGERKNSSAMFSFELQHIDKPVLTNPESLMFISFSQILNVTKRNFRQRWPLKMNIKRKPGESVLSAYLDDDDDDDFRDDFLFFFCFCTTHAFR